MTNNYRPVSDRARAIHGEEDLELDLSPADEQDALSGGHLEIVPRRYLVLVDNFADAKQGATYEAAYPADREAALLSGGVLQRVQDDAEDNDSEPADRTLGEVLADPNDGRAFLPEGDPDPDADAVPPDTKPAASKPVANKEED